MQDRLGTENVRVNAANANRNFSRVNLLYILYFQKYELKEK